MAKIEFYKLQAAGNDFIVVEGKKPKALKINLKKFARTLCQRKEGIGADGLLVVEPSHCATFKMRIFNPDGSEAEMCGNGARCLGLWAKKVARTRSKMTFETQAGIIEAVAKNDMVKIKLSEPNGVKTDVPVKILGRRLRLNCINTGVPHAVIFVEGLDRIDVDRIGHEVRFHKKFAPQGTNVNFVEVVGDDAIAVRTYERGVERETLACGTGAVASAIITNFKQESTNHKNTVSVLTKSGERLKVFFDRRGNNIHGAWLEGKAHLVYRGILNAHKRGGA